MNPSCESVRESLSALMDREWPALGREEVTAHLSGCPDCRQWQDRALDATRRARAAFPRPERSLADAVLARLGARPRSPWSLPLRVLLGLAGWGIAALAVPALVYGQDAEAPPHVAHEMGSLNVALGLALLLAAFRPLRAGGVLPIFAVVVGLLALTAGDDILDGNTTWAHEAPHALIVVGFVMLLALTRIERPVSGSGPRGRRGSTAPATILPGTAGRPGTGTPAPRRRAM